MALSRTVVQPQTSSAVHVPRELSSRAEPPSATVGRVRALLNPSNATTAGTTLQDMQEAARALGLQIHVFNASTIREIDAAFAALARESPAVAAAHSAAFRNRNASASPAI